MSNREQRMQESCLRRFSRKDITWGMVIGLRKTSWATSQFTGDTHLDASTQCIGFSKDSLTQGNVANLRSAGGVREKVARVD
ncbi:hypothetical protein TNCV_3634641 [Trichonephila clavipes]|nr:hypothetical protein TNCV_3634641 [Trichonephila clavipes]